MGLSSFQKLYLKIIIGAGTIVMQVVPVGRGRVKKVLKIQGKITAGLKDSEIAVEFGVTRQYANYLRNKRDNKTIQPTKKMRG